MVCNRLRAVFLLLVAVLAAGCQTYVSTDVTVFHQWPPGGAGRSYAFDPVAEQRGSLEYQAYADLIRQQLFGWGFAEKPVAQAELLLVFHANVDNGKTVTDSHPEYVQRCTPVYNRRRDVYENYCAQEYAGSSVESYVRYRHELSLELRDGAAQRRNELRKLYEGRASADSGCPQLNAVMPYLVKALLREFPGSNGRSVVVNVPVPNRQHSLFSVRGECDSLAP